MAEELEESVWSKLPAELLEQVLRRLPLEVLYRFRTVCKYWRTLPTSPKFCSSFANPRCEQSYLLGIQQIGSLQRCPLYKPLTYSWSFIDLGFLEARFERFTFEHWERSYDERWGDSDIKLVSSDGGLLCVCARVHESEQDAIFVCNPLTRACSLLPLIEGSTWGECLELAIHMENYGQYRVVATTEERGDFARLYMYYSVSASWKLLPLYKGVPFDSSVGVFYKGLYYLLTAVISHDNVLMSYDIENDAWLDTGMVMPIDGLNMRLVVSNDRLFCISFTGDENDNGVYVSIVEVNLYMSIVSNISTMDRLALKEEERFYMNQEVMDWNAIGYRNSIIVVTRTPVLFEYDLTADLPEWRPMNLDTFERSQLPKSLAAFTFDLRATVD